MTSFFISVLLGLMLGSPATPQETTSTTIEKTTIEGQTNSANSTNFGGTGTWIGAED